MVHSTGIVRAEGQVVTSVAATGYVTVHVLDPVTGQRSPRQITVSDFFTGGGVSFTPGSIIFADNLGSLGENNTNLFWNDSTNTAVITNVDLGASGTAGSLDIFPTTASKGKISLVAANNAGNTTLTITNASQSGAYTYTIPDAAAAASFVMQNSGTATEASNAVTLSKLSGVITTSSLTTAAGSSYAITWTNTYVSSTSRILITRAGGTNTRHSFNMDVVAGSGSATLTIYNNEPTNALNGTIIFNFFVIP